VQPSGPNAEQIEYWNRDAGPKWVRLQDRLDAQLRPLGDAALDRAALVAGERVLDVGCGCGDTTLRAAARVAPDGHALGIDVSEPMLARARERAAAEGRRLASFVHADAQTHAFEPGSVDVLVSRFGVMFFREPEAAFANLRGALAPGGRLAFVCWRPVAENPWMFAPMAAAAKHLPLTPPEPGAPGPFAFQDEGRVRDILEAGGFARVAHEPLSGELSVGGAGDLDDAVDFLLEVGPAARALREAGGGEDLARRVADAVRESLVPFAGPGGVRMPYAAWIVTARHGGA